jgi:hypothetical protein
MTKPTMSMPRSNVLAWFTPSPIQTRIPERYAASSPEAVKPAETMKATIQSGAAIRSAGEGASRSLPMAAKRITTRNIRMKAVTPNFQAAQA